MVHELNKKNIKDIVEQATKPVVIDISAPWCGPCIQMKPIFHQLGEELGDRYVFCELNVDEERDLAIQYSVTSIPTFLFIRNNATVGKEIGYLSKDVLRTKLQEYLG